MAIFRGNRKRIPIKKRGLILCEGETEENYFRGLTAKEEYRRKFEAISVEIYKPKDHSPKGLVTEAKVKAKTAKKEKDPYDFVWVVFDRDGHQNIANAFHEAITFNPRIHIAFTVTCFEYFILLHFTKTTKAFTKCDDVISDLKHYLPGYKKATNLFELTEKKMADGLANSEWCHNHYKKDIDAGKNLYDCDPYSNIHLLVSYLLTLTTL